MVGEKEIKYVSICRTAQWCKNYHLIGSNHIAALELKARSSLLSFVAGILMCGFNYYNPTGFSQLFVIFRILRGNVAIT
jgi:hypothetical protein